MKILISPAKNLHTSNIQLENPTLPIFQEKANYLASLIKNLNLDEIKTAFKVNDKLANLIKDRYLNFNKKLFPALYLFNGLQYKNINLKDLKEDEIDFLLKNLYISDSLYGIIRASDLISEYRLDYNTKLSFFSKNYYKEELANYLKEPFINLCSKEFSQIFPKSNQININFSQNINQKIKSYSTHTKIARGKFINYLAKEKCLDYNTLINFKEDYYILDRSKTDSNNIYYIKY